MSRHDKHPLTKPYKILKAVYILLLFFMAFTGFGQMPISKRYYISDIPGMGWSADFFTTHILHYLGAIVLIGLLAFFITDYLLLTRRRFRLTRTAYLRMILLGGLVITGILRVFKNLPDVTFSPGFTFFIDVAHLGFTMVFALTVLVLLIMKTGWVVARPEVIRPGRVRL